jgi:hypothetical protein
MKLCITCEGPAARGRNECAACAAYRLRTGTPRPERLWLAQTQRAIEREAIARAYGWMLNLTPKKNPDDVA